MMQTIRPAELARQRFVPRLKQWLGRMMKPDRPIIHDYQEAIGLFVTMAVFCLKNGSTAGWNMNTAAIGSKIWMERHILIVLEFLKKNITPADPAVLTQIESIQAGRDITSEAQPYLSSMKEISDFFDWVAKNIQPMGGEGTPNLPSETLRIRQGNCRSKSFLLASMLGAKGYDTHILEGPGHFALRARIPVLDGINMHQAAGEIRDYIDRRYHECNGIHTFTESDGVWVVLDPTLSDIPGRVQAYTEQMFQLVYDWKNWRLLTMDGKVIAERV